MVSRWPNSLAKCIAVNPFPVVAVIFAPALRSSRTISGLPPTRDIKLL